MRNRKQHNSAFLIIICTSLPANIFSENDRSIGSTYKCGRCLIFRRGRESDREIKKKERKKDITISNRLYPAQLK